MVGNGGRGGLQFLGTGLVRQDSTGVEAEVDKELFQFIDVTNAEKCSHIALQYTLHNIFPQKSLTQVDIFLGCRFREAAHQKVPLKKRLQGSHLVGQSGEVLGLKCEQVIDPKISRDAFGMLVANQNEFIKREGRDRNGNPAADTAFGQSLSVDHTCGSRCQDAVLLLMVHQQLYFGLPFGGILNFIQQ